MEPKDQDLIHRYQNRLTQILEPDELLKYLVNSGVLSLNEETAILQTTGDLAREHRVVMLLNCLRHSEVGFYCFLKGILLNGKQDFIARELLEDEACTEEDVKTLLQEVRNYVDEIQVLKLELLLERKKNESTKRELEEVKSSRNSMVFSDSGCSGLESSDTDTFGYVLRELEEERKRREEAESDKRRHEQELEHLTRKNQLLEQSNKELLRTVRSLEDLSSVDSAGESIWENRLPWKASSLADLCHSDEYSESEGERMVKWSSVGDGRLMCKDTYGVSISPISDKSSGYMELVQKVNLLEEKLQEERTRRENSEFEMMKLGFENEELILELEETKENLRGSQMDLLDGTNYDDCCEEAEMEEIYSDPWNGTRRASELDCYDKHADFHFTNNAIQTSSFKSSTPIRQQPHGSPVIRHAESCTSVSSACFHGDPVVRRSKSYNNIASTGWRRINVEHYEMDEYEREFDSVENRVETDISEVIRGLRTDTYALMHHIMEEGKALRNLRMKAERLKSGHWAEQSE